FRGMADASVTHQSARLCASRTCVAGGTAWAHWSFSCGCTPASQARPATRVRGRRIAQFTGHPRGSAHAQVKRNLGVYLWKAALLVIALRNFNLWLFFVYLLALIK